MTKQARQSGKASTVRNEPSDSRRKAIKTLLLTGGGLISAKSVPDKWKKPVVDSVLLPAHAQPLSARPQSDRNIKENIVAVNEQAILQKLDTLNIESWNYIGEDTPHIGPMAQDFKSTFNLGDSDKHIHVVDMNGVNMASIKALSSLVKEQAEELKNLKEELTGLKTKLT